MNRLSTKALVFLALIVLLTISVGTAHAQEPATVKITQNVEFGDILTDAGENALYLFTKDERNKSNCSGGCATAWPPLLTAGNLIAGEGVNDQRLGTIMREDGSTQVAYNGWPLYYFANDDSAGDTNGQTVGGVWFVVSAFGGPIQTNAVIDTAEHAELGSILADASGRSLYLFTPDELNLSTCNGGCALAWPPVITVNNPRADGSVVGTWLNTITRTDGSRHVTYNGVPLYYFARDDKPGDTNGQTVGDVWFVVSLIGEAVGMTASTPPAESGGPVAPVLPSVGDTAVNVIARWSLVASLILVSTGGLILVRSRRRNVPGATVG
jgi:predicted lipoprotein with Yx(FWY)xxD motif